MLLFGRVPVREAHSSACRRVLPLLIYTTHSIYLTISNKLAARESRFLNLITLGVPLSSLTNGRWRWRKQSNVTAGEAAVCKTHYAACACTFTDGDEYRPARNGYAACACTFADEDEYWSA